MNSLLEITQDAFDRLPINVCKAMHKLREFVNCERNVRTGDGEILQNPNSTSIQSDIRNGTPLKSR